MHHRTTPLAAALAATLLAGLLAGGSAPSVAAVPSNATAARSADSYADTAFRATNNKRKQHHRAALRHNDCLQKYAVRNAKRMARREVMEHQDLGPIQRDCGVGWVGENIAAGYPSGRAVVKGWMHSQGHRENILRRQFKLMGLAARKSDHGTWYAAQVFGKKA